MRLIHNLLNTRLFFFYSFLWWLLHSQDLEAVGPLLTPVLKLSTFSVVVWKKVPQYKVLLLTWKASAINRQYGKRNQDIFSLGLRVFKIFLQNLFYFVLRCNWLMMLWSFQVNSKGTQPFTYMYPFSPQTPLSSRLLHNTGQSSMCYTVGPIGYLF